MGKEVSKNYSDKAMFTAAPVADKTPKVYLLNATPDPLGSVAAMNYMYTGRPIRSLDEITDEDRERNWEDVQKTVLKAPFESVKLHFMFEGVTRAFTHQLVRQRTAVYAQESMRFAVKENATDEVALPPSLMGTMDENHWIEEKRRILDEQGVAPGDKYNAAYYSITGDNEQQARLAWDDAMEVVGQTYNRLIELGMPAEDARGMLPTNILTRIHYITDLRALQQHAGFRLCTQAQFEWRMVWLGILQALRGFSSCPGHPYNKDDEKTCRICDNWQWQRLATIFKPICYQTGKCEFMSNIDRHCSIRDRVNANHEVGRPSSDWDNSYDPFPNGGTAPVVERDSNNKPVFIGPIHPREWMFDPAAARTR